MKNRHMLQFDFQSPDSITCYVNKEYGLPAQYVPEHLVIPDVLHDNSYPEEKRYLRVEAAFALENMFEAALRSHLEMAAVSGYRSYKRQEEIYNENVRLYGREETECFSARPGHSEHQTGLAMDVSTAALDYQLEETFAETPEGIWLAENAHIYGFILRYPKEKSDITGYNYEPWHIRYVGRGFASLLFCYGITFDECVVL